MKILIVIFSVILCIISCSGPHDKKYDTKLFLVKDMDEITILDSIVDIDSICCLYFNYIFEESFISVNCDEILPSKNQDFRNEISYNAAYRGVVEIVIKEKNVVDLISRQIKKIEYSEDHFSINARFTSKIFYSDGTIGHICLCSPFVYRTLYNDKPCKIDLKLLYLLKYHSGFYTWIKKTDLEKMPEIIDTTFYKEPITMTYENNPRIQVE